MQDFLLHYAQLTPDTGALLVAFALASWFPDCIPIAPILYLLGPEGEARLVLRLLATLCRRPTLLADIDLTALRSLPPGLNASLLINHRDLPRNVRRFLLALGDPNFHVAIGNNNRHTCSARSISSRAESTSGSGVRVVLSPTTDELPPLSDDQQKALSDDFQSQLLRYRQVHFRQVRDAKPDVRVSTAATRDELCAWLSPLLNSANFQDPVVEYFLQRNRATQADRITDDLCVAAEAALFLCHRQNTDHFFVRELAEAINKLLQGRRELRAVTDKKRGCSYGSWVFQAIERRRDSRSLSLRRCARKLERLPEPISRRPWWTG